MSISLNTWHQRTRWTRIALAAFLVAWLNLAAQPCLMAMERTAETATETGLGTHSGASNGPHCGDCQQGMSIGHNACATSVVFACENIPDLILDASSKLPEPNDAPTFVQMEELSPTFDYVLRKDSARSTDRVSLSYPGSPPLNVRHCVFLI